MANVNLVFETIAEALQEGADVRITGFGTFEVRQRTARTGRNPRTGEAVDIPAARVPAFKPLEGPKGPHQQLVATDRPRGTRDY